MRDTQHILVVDDEQAICKLLVRQLRDLGGPGGVRVESLCDADDALEAAQLQQPDLVLLDVQIGRRNGFDVIRELKADPRTHDIPVIFITGESDPQQMVQGFDLGAVDYVTKPFEPAELQARVRNALKTKSLLDMLTAQAEIDGLTGLHNRRHFDERLAQELAAAQRYGRRLGLILLDIDYFKRMNDRYGHPKGDAVIRGVSAVLRETCRTSDIPCRYGGDELAAILPEVDTDGLLHFGERLTHAIRTDRELQAQFPLLVTCSLGGAQSTPDCRDPIKLVARADEALYRSKNEGRDRFTLYRNPQARRCEAAAG